MEEQLRKIAISLSWVTIWLFFLAVNSCHYEQEVCKPVKNTEVSHG